MGQFFSAVRTRMARLFLWVMAQILPRQTARRAIELFSRTMRFPPPPVEKDYMNAARIRRLPVRCWDTTFKTPYAEMFVPEELVGFEFGPETNEKGTVLLVCGWAGRGLQLHAFVNPLASLGYRVIALDMPGGGATDGDYASPVIFANALEGLIRANDIRPAAIIAHSMGGIATLILAARCRDEPDICGKLSSLAVIGAPDKTEHILEGFAKEIGISGTRADKLLEKELERRHGDNIRLRNMASSHLLSQVSLPLLVLHDLNDKEVPVSSARSIAAAATRVLDHRASDPSVAAEATRGFTFEYVETQGLGHKRILADPEVVKKVVGFVRERDQRRQ